MLASRPGELVSREELQREIWGDGTFVDFEHGVNFCISRIRAALGDDAENPRFVETLPRRGYRFIAPLERLGPMASKSAATPKPAPIEFAAPEAGESEDNPHLVHAESRRALSLATALKPQTDKSDVLPFPAPEPVSSPQVSTQAGRRLRILPSFLAAIALVVAGVAAYELWPVPPPRVLRKVQLTHFGRAVNWRGMVTDGARIFFSEVQGGRETIDQVPVAGGDPTAFPLPFANAEVLDISPDHTDLLVASFTGLEDDDLFWVVPVTGGAPRRLDDAAGSSAAWSPDGQTIAYTRGVDLFTVHRDGNGPRRLLGAKGVSKLYRVRWSPAGRTLRFTVEQTASPFNSQWEIAADGANPHPLPTNPETRPGSDSRWGCWTPQGRYFVYLSSEGDASTIWASRESGSILRSLRRRPVEIYEDPHSLSAPLVSIDGKRVFFIEDQERRELVRYDSASRQFVPYLGGIFAREVNFSRDGKSVAYALSPPFEVWYSKVDGSERRPLTFPPMSARGPIFSPDGRQIAFGALEAGMPAGLYLLPVEGNSKPELALAGNYYGGLVGWSSDGRSLLFWQQPDPAAHFGLYSVDLKTHEVSLLPGSEGLHHAALSPDGLRIAASSEAGKSVVLYDLQTHQQTELAQGAAVYSPLWAHDGKAVFFQDIYQGSDQPIYRVRIADHSVNRVTDFAQPFAADVTGYRLTGLTPDDNVLATLIRSNSDLYALDVEFP
jgi:Tol biopolymer transport system component/DNA-binding winged helix-turn-helix (wHTH) protein